MHHQSDIQEAGAFGGRLARGAPRLEEGGVEAAPLRAEPEGRLLSWPAETVYEYDASYWEAGVGWLWLAASLRE